ncbi:membrane metal-binding protein ComEC [Mycobacterium triplex]|uniref:Membrane metal-binding protein ComEC n=1 Tax=Mycobacterium triplex TaxID=47839 RepID=A0A024K289_9MYCO|nr:membrane metal-binding protein ComEC [Mycobacterium triplex]
MSDLAAPPRGLTELARLDVRLVPAALTGWLVTACGIVWPVGRVLASCCLALVAAAGPLAWCTARRAGRHPRRRAVAAGLVAIGVVGAGFGFAIALRADAVARHPITAAFGTIAPVTVTPSESALSLGSGRLMFRATLQRLRDDEISGRVTVFARASDFDVRVGQPLRFSARINRPGRHDLTVAMLNAAGRPVPGRAGAVQRAAHVVRGRFAATAHEVLPAAQAALLTALVLGDTSALTAETVGEFRAAGLTHLTAVSGANVTIVCAAVLFSGRLIGPRAAVLLAGVALLAFVIVVQPTASVLRAAVMGAIALAGMLTARRRQAIPALSATVLLLLAVTPQLAVDAGFALSVLATGALIVVAPGWSRRLAAKGCPKPLADGLAVALAAQVVTAPLVAGISGRFSLVAVAANLAAAPVVAPVTVLGSAAAVLCVLWPPGAQLLMRFTGPEVWWVAKVAHVAAHAPAATVPVPDGPAGVLLVGCSTALLLALAAVLWRRPWFRASTRAAGLVAVVCALAWSASELLDPRADWSGIRDTIVG